MEEKICFITGANSGIGKSAAILFAQQGFKVIIGCRNYNRGEKALNEIKHKSSNENVVLKQIDMSSQSSIGLLAKDLTDNIEKLDILIHNAADFDISRKEPAFSQDNIETVWATNHIGPVLLTKLLLDLLNNSKQGRILTVASQGLMFYPFFKINIDDPEFKNKEFSVNKAYYQSKLAQVMYTYWLSDKLKDTKITVNCIRVTNVKIDITRYLDLSKMMKFLYSIKSKFSISPDEMAKTYLYLATAKELEKISGKYFNEKNQIVSSSKYSLNKENIDSLMNLTMKYIKPAFCQI